VARNFPDDFTGIRVSPVTLRKGKTVFLKMYYPEPQKGKSILAAILGHYRDLLEKNDREFQTHRTKLEKDIEEFREKLAGIALKRERLTREIRELQRKIQIKTKERNLLEDSVKAHLQTIKNLQRVITEVEENTRELVRLRTEFLKNVSSDGSHSPDQLTLMLYSNIIQQNISYISSLEMRLLSLKKERLNVEKRMDQVELALVSLRKQLENLKQKRDKELAIEEALLRAKEEKVETELRNLEPFDIIQPPTSSPRPVKPKRLLVVAVAGVSGMFVGIFIAFFVQAWENRRLREVEA